MNAKQMKIAPRFSRAVLDKTGCYSFLNFASLTSFFAERSMEELDYFCDGWLMCSIVRLLTGVKVDRVSFDYTSIAAEVFNQAGKKGKKIFIVGAEREEIKIFVKKIALKHNDLNVTGYHDGYFNETDEQSKLVDSIIASGADLVIAGLGAGKQERFLLSLKGSGFTGLAFSCGGFIRQEACANKPYYPVWINKLNLRAFYRMYKEPHTIPRYIINYPINASYLVYLVLSNQMEIKFSGECDG